MAIKTFNPTSPGRRNYALMVSPELTKAGPQKNLLSPLSKSGGRNNNGRVTARHIGGGHKRKYRIIDFKRDKQNIAGKVSSLEYDPNRSANIALITYADGEKKYILAPLGLREGDNVISGELVDVKIGNCMPMGNMPMGSVIHNVEMKIGKGAQLVRSAGVSAQLMAKEGDYVLIKLPSGEVRKFHKFCRACFGQLGNVEYDSQKIGKAGRNRWMGNRPKVRGVAMNPHDHPMGGGEGKSSGGRHPCSPWGMPSKGFKTRKKKESDKYIITKRS